MNLNTITEVKRPTSTDEIPEWRKGYAWLAGGTWLFSTPQIATHTLIDLETLRWPALQLSPDGLELAATCTIAELEQFQAPANWTAAPLLKLCCHALLMSFKIYNAATVGGNICMSLPAGAMISLMVSLEGTYTLWPRGGRPRKLAALDFVTGNHMNVLEPGELLRSIHLPASALEKRFAFRRNSLTHLGRSAALFDRHPDQDWRRFLAHHHGGDGQTDTASFRPAAVGQRLAPRHRRGRPRFGLVRRCPRLGAL